MDSGQGLDKGKFYLLTTMLDVMDSAILIIVRDDGCIIDVGSGDLYC